MPGIFVCGDNVLVSDLANKSLRSESFCYSRYTNWLTLYRSNRGSLYGALREADE